MSTTHQTHDPSGRMASIISQNSSNSLFESTKSHHTYRSKKTTVLEGQEPSMISTIRDYFLVELNSFSSSQRMWGTRWILRDELGVEYVPLLSCRLAYVVRKTRDRVSYSVTRIFEILDGEVEFERSKPPTITWDTLLLSTSGEFERPKRNPITFFRVFCSFSQLVWERVI